MSECVTHHACDCIRQELEGYRNGNRDLHEECQRLRRERDDARNQVEDVIGVEASSWMLRAQTLKVELEKSEAECDELRADNQKRCAELLALEFDLDETKAERDHMAGELPIIEQAMVGYRDEAEALRVECDLWKEQADGVNADLLDALAERDRYLEEIRERDARLLSEAKVTDALRAERDELQKQLDATRGMIAYSINVVADRAEQAEAERDRYRAALERIASGSRAIAHSFAAKWASDALNGGTND